MIICCSRKEGFCFIEEIIRKELKSTYEMVAIQVILPA